MADRENSPAYAALPRNARRVFDAISRAIGDSSSASVSFTSFRLDYHIGGRAISASLKLLDHLGLIEIEPGPRLVNVFRFSNRWRTVEEVEAKLLAELAREVKPHRTFGKPPEPKPVKQPKPKPMTVARPRVVRRRVPSLPTMPWQDDGRWADLMSSRRRERGYRRGSSSLLGSLSSSARAVCPLCLSRHPPQSVAACLSIVAGRSSLAWAATEHETQTQATILVDKTVRSAPCADRPRTRRARRVDPQRDVLDIAQCGQAVEKLLGGDRGTTSD